VNRAAVLGAPISHSLSPALHNAAYRAAGLDDWEYTSFEVQAPQLAGFLSEHSKFRGFSLTMPLKEECLRVADSVTALAARAGAGNTLSKTDDGWLADNTDIGGFVDALVAAGIGLVACESASPSPAPEPGPQNTNPPNTHPTSAAILGAGGTARAAVLALLELGVGEMTIYTRSRNKGEAFADWAASVGANAKAGDLAVWNRSDEPLVISTLPPGVELAVDMGKRGLVFDVVYAGWPTALGAAAQNAGIKVLSGLDLLVRQAARQFQIFTGVAADVEAMYKAGREGMR
jgi:shikimate dehydrogenase